MEHQIKKQAIRYGVVAFLLAIILGTFIYSFGSIPSNLVSNVSPVPAAHSSLLTTFSSSEELKHFLEINAQNSDPFVLVGPLDTKLFSRQADSTFASVTSNSAGAQAEVVEHSTTNIQVEGVDEPDIVKTDDYGYVYVLSNDTVFIIVAYPPEHAAVLSKLRFNLDDMVPVGIFISGDRLTVLGSEYIVPAFGLQDIFPFLARSIVPTLKSFMKIYDIKDRSNPILVRDLALTGSYFDARMIGNYIYLVSGTGAYITNGEPILPEITTNGKAAQISATEIRYFNGTEEYYQYTTLMTVNAQNATEAPVYLTVMSGTTSGMYVSQDNMYLTFQNWSWNGANTTVYRIHMKASNMTVEAKGTIPGQGHNQFSMDEYNGYFRMQTSTYKNWTSYTNVYVLNMNLTITGKLENLAPGESFYSVRFLGNRCYLVTFMKIDPLFVIDLSNVTDPRVLGELKIPGYSDYLHPYDETHLIGVGKETADSGDSGFAWYQGIKVSLFDVSNMTNPLQVSKYVIGDRGSDTPVLYDHKAFLFSEERHLLVMPVSVAEIDPNEYSGEVPSWAYGNIVWQGAYVFDISTYHDMILEGRITHLGNGTDIYSQQYWVQRSFYIENVLYTVSNSMLKMNSLDDLSDLGQVELN